jgi:hypothetical protein
VNWIARIRWVASILLIGLLAGCSGGGGSANSVPTISLSIQRASDGVNNAPVTSSQPARITIKASADELVTLSTTVGALSKTTVTPVNGVVDVLLSVSLLDVNDGEVTATQANGASAKLAFSIGAVNLAIGRMQNGVFTEGQLELGQAILSPGGTTQVSALVWDTALNQAYGQPINVEFKSTCIDSGKSTISSPVLAVNGVANTTYKAINCSGSDTVTASVNVGGSSRTASGVITFPPAATSSIQFIESNPDRIDLIGVGAAQTEVKIPGEGCHRQPAEQHSGQFYAEYHCRRAGAHGIEQPDRCPGLCLDQYHPRVDSLRGAGDRTWSVGPTSARSRVSCR